MDRRAILLGIAGSVLVLAYLVAQGPAYESVAIVLATFPLVPVGVVVTQVLSSSSVANGL